MNFRTTRPHPTPTPHLHDAESLTSMHTIPHEPDHSAATPTTTPSENLPDETPPPSIQETPPSSL